jgi:hypothetical protein
MTPMEFGKKPIDCTCAKWYQDGTHAPECLHITDPEYYQRARALCRGEDIQPPLFTMVRDFDA